MPCGKNSIWRFRRGVTEKDGAVKRVELHDMDAYGQRKKYEVGLHSERGLLGRWGYENRGGREVTKSKAQFKKIVGMIGGGIEEADRKIELQTRQGDKV